MGAVPVGGEMAAKVSTAHVNQHVHRLNMRQKVIAGPTSTNVITDHNEAGNVFRSCSSDPVHVVL